jgi:hypothetical protein
MDHVEQGFINFTGTSSASTAPAVVDVAADFETRLGMLGSRDHVIFSDSESSSESGDLEQEVLIGPTDMGVSGLPITLQQLYLPPFLRNGVPNFNADASPVPIRSGPRRMILSEYLRLKHCRPPAAISFGSAIHLNFGPDQGCRPCMYERRPGRCAKSFLCDFCHLHVGRNFRRQVVVSKARGLGKASSAASGPGEEAEAPLSVPGSSEEAAESSTLATLAIQPKFALPAVLHDPEERHQVPTAQVFDEHQPVVVPAASSSTEIGTLSRGKPFAKHQPFALPAATSGTSQRHPTGTDQEKRPT